MKKLQTIQPIRNLQNYSKNIIPIINDGKAVYLTKHGHNDLVIQSNQSYDLERQKNALLQKELGSLLELRLIEIDKEPSYTGKQVEKMMKKFE